MDQLLLRLDSNFESLSGQDEAVRVKAIRSILRLACGNWTSMRKESLTNPELIQHLLQLTSDRNIRVAEDSIIALGMISQRYDFRPRQIPDRLIPMFDGSSDALRIRIACALPQYGTVQVFRLILVALECRPTSFAHELLSWHLAAYCNKLRSSPLRNELCERLMRDVRQEKNANAAARMIQAIVSLQPNDLKAWASLLPKRLKKNVPQSVFG